MTVVEVVLLALRFVLVIAAASFLAFVIFRRRRSTVWRGVRRQWTSGGYSLQTMILAAAGGLAIGLGVVLVVLPLKGIGPFLTQLFAAVALVVAALSLKRHSKP